MSDASRLDVAAQLIPGEMGSQIGEVVIGETRVIVYEAIDGESRPLGTIVVEVDSGTEPMMFYGDPENGETYDDDTMTKVYMALGRSGLADVQITDAIANMQNAGILFRERP